jgi:hypothetical protein
MPATTARPGAVVRLRDGTFGVVLQRNTRSADLLAVDVWHAGAVLVRRRDVVEVVVPRAGGGDSPGGGNCVTTLREPDVPLPEPSDLRIEERELEAGGLN